MRSNFFTTNQHDIIRVAKISIAKKSIIGIMAPHYGIGFKFSIVRLKEEFPYQNIIFADCSHSRNLNEVIITLLVQCSNVRFSNLNYRRTTLFDLTRILKQRMKIDLKGDTLIVLDKVSKLSLTQKKYLCGFFEEFDHCCGLIFRTSLDDMVRLKAAKTKIFYEEFYNAVDDWKVLNPHTTKAGEIESLCKHYGVKDLEFIKTLNKKTQNFTTAKKFIDRYLTLKNNEKAAES